MNDWPPNPGSTVMTSTMSSSSRYGSSADSGVPGLTASPAARPAARIARRVGSIASSISTWNVIESQPASRYSSRKRPGSLDHQVGIERQLGPRAQVLDGLRAERQVGDEVAVHDVEVDAVGARRLDAADGVGQVERSASRMLAATRADRRPRLSPPPRPGSARDCARPGAPRHSRRRDARGAARRPAAAARRRAPRRAGRRRRRPPGRGCAGSSSRSRRHGASPRSASMTGIGLAVHGVWATGFIGIRLTWA